MAGFKNLQALRHFVDGRPAMTERKDDRLWGGRFAGEPDAQFDRFQRSFAFDRRLLAYEIAVDRAWAKALEPIGIFTAAEVRQTLAALDKMPSAQKRTLLGSILSGLRPKTSITLSRRLWSKSLDRSGGNCTRAAAATNSSPRIFACL